MSKKPAFWGYEINGRVFASYRDKETADSAMTAHLKKAQTEVPEIEHCGSVVPIFNGHYEKKSNGED